MSIRELRILPPYAIARMGSAPEPLDSYTIELDPHDPLGFRRIRGARTLIVDEESGQIAAERTPRDLEFRMDGKIRPVAPFLEVWAVTDDDDLQPLTLGLLESHGLSPSDVSWRVSVANRKVERRTSDPNDAVFAQTKQFSSHEPQQLTGRCKNFVKGGVIEFGSARYIKPTKTFPEIRLRFTPATGLIYGPDKQLKDDPYDIPKARAVYDSKKGSWKGFKVPPVVDSGGAPSTKGPFRFWNETFPPSLFAIMPPAPPWLHGNVAKSRGYFDDACDGFVEVELALTKKKSLSATARISAGPPLVVPDTLFVRTLLDDLEQAIFGPDIPEDEPHEVTRARAEDIVRRAYETVRFLNVAVMNGNVVQGRDPLMFDTMPAEEAFDTQRLMRPAMAPASVDTLAVLALHQQVFAAIQAGAAPWFLRILRRPDEVTDYTDHGRRKMPALMAGADGSYLALTWRQIDTIRKAVDAPLFEPALGAGTKTKGKKKDSKQPGKAALTPRNRSAHISYVADGNPVSTSPVTAIGNCTPGLEVDFRAVWRRMFEGIVLREWDNLVVEVDDDVTDPKKKKLAGHRLLRIDRVSVVAQMLGPSPADPAGDSVVLATDVNPAGLAPLEWSNALARILRTKQGKTVTCDFSKDPSWYQHVALTEHPKNYVSVRFKVRHFFEGETAVISRALAKAGELTQGLCSPWQNDYRECSCYYWASARPDYVNVEATTAGTSTGDNWMQKGRTGSYVADDYEDYRLIGYDDLFKHWEELLRIVIRGRDGVDGDHRPE
jgi:hypothetical protein